MRIFVINLRRSADRRDRMKEALDSLGAPFEFFEGTDGRELGADAVEELCDRVTVALNLGRALSASEIGCAVSHRSVYRKILDDGTDQACVLEDDAVLDPRLPDVLRFLDSRPLWNTVVKLDNYQERSTPCGLWSRRKIYGPYRLKRPVTTQWMAWGYVIDRTAAGNILRAWPKVAFAADDWKRMSSVVRLLCVQPAVVHRNAAVESIIDDDRNGLLAGMRGTASRPSRAGRLVYLIKTIGKMVAN